MGTLDSGQVEVGNLGGRLSGSNIGVESLFQVIKAVEAAENIIRKQVSWHALIAMSFCIYME